MAKILWARGGKEVSRFSIEKLFSHTAENLRRESFAVGLLSGTQKLWIRGVSIKTFRQKCFLSHSAEIFPREYFIVAIISRTEKVWRRGGGGGRIKIFRQKFLSHTAENFRREYFFVALISGTEKFWRRGGRIKNFRQNYFLSHSPENFRMEYIILATTSRTEKVWRRGGREYQEFPSNFFCLFCLTVSKISVGESLTVALISGSEKVYGQEGGREYQDFPSKNVCLTLPKNSVGNLLLLD